MSNAEAEGSQVDMVDVAAANIAEYTTSLPATWKAHRECDECLHAGGLCAAVDDDHWLRETSLHTDPAMRALASVEATVSSPERATEEGFGRDDGRRGVHALVDAGKWRRAALRSA